MIEVKYGKENLEYQIWNWKFISKDKIWNWFNYWYKIICVDTVWKIKYLLIKYFINKNI